MRCLEVVIFYSGRRYFSTSEYLINPLWHVGPWSTTRRKAHPHLLCPDVGNFHFNVSRLFTVPGLNKRREHVGKKLVGFSMEQTYEVVADVENYKSFVPFCRESKIVSRTENEMWCELEIGFPPITESYVSHVVLQKPRQVVSSCSDGKILKDLKTTWRFAPGLKDRPQTCVIYFSLSFEFESLVHSQLAHFFFTELVKQMETAFLDETKRRFGPPSIKTIPLKVS